MGVRVLWLTKGLGPGGAERLLVELARSLDRDQVHVDAAYVLPWKDHLAGELEAAGVGTTCLSQRDPDPRWPLALRQLIATGDYNVVHAHAPVPAVAARIAVRTLPADRRPAILTTEHNTWDSYHPLTRWANRVTGSQDQATFAVTAEAAASMQGRAAEQVVVLQHGIDVAATADRPPGTRERIRAELGIRSDQPVLVTVANYRAQKDYPNLLAAARRLIDRGVDAHLVAVGQGPLEAEITALVDQLGLRDHVTLTGFRADAVDVVAAADVFTLASAWEGLPVAVMEALALGRPIVATAVGGLRESLDDSAAVLVPPGDPDALAAAWADVLSDPDRRATLAAGARALAPRFDIAHAAATLTETYRRLARAHGAPPASAPGPTAADAVRPSEPRRTGPVAAIREATAEDRPAILALLGESLGWDAADDRYPALFAWKHETNPFGPSMAWVAEEAGDIVAVRLFMRWRFRRGGRPVTAVRAVDTATRPSHQGRGLFRRLTLHGLEHARTDGVDLVFNTPNEQSRPGYLKMGWRQIGRLPTAIRSTRAGRMLEVIRSNTAADLWSQPLTYGESIDEWLAGPNAARIVDQAPTSSTDRALRTDTSEAFARWRYGLPELAYRVVDDGRATIVVRLRTRGAATELVVAEQLGHPVAADRLAARTARDVGASHAIRLGASRPLTGFLPVPGGGPILTWRAVNDLGPSPLPNWHLQLRDVELF